MKSLIAPIIEESPYFPSLKKYLLGSCSTGLFQPLLKKSFTRASAASEPIEVRWIWCLSFTKFRRSVENKTWDYANFIDLTKAFDMVSRTGLWLILERLCCPPKFLQMVIQLHENQRGQVRLNGDLSEPFSISNGVKQGCLLAPTLFSSFSTMMLKQATADLDDDEGAYIKHRLDGILFNLRRLQAHTNTQERLIQNFLFADDAALVAHTERALQRMTSCFADASRLFGLEVSLKKTVILHQPTTHEEYRQHFTSALATLN